VCKLYLLFRSADAALEKEKKEGAAFWCFKVYRPYSNLRASSVREAKLGLGFWASVSAIGIYLTHIFTVTI
jgi:hypothetical protein